MKPLRHASLGWHLRRRRATIGHGARRYTYIMTNKARGVLYIGVTADLAARIVQHRNGAGSAFCKRYGLTCLVLAERHDDITYAIAREKALKAWKRAWKIRLIEENNPDWRDSTDLIL